MNMYKFKIILVAVLTAISLTSFAHEDAININFGEPKINHKDEASLQRGAGYYMNFCSGCHSLKFMRYERMAKDIGITKNDGSVAVDVLKDNLMFNADKVGAHIESSINVIDSAKWFGNLPPDLTLESRARGEQWLFNYLLGFYRDSNRPWGVNNVVFPDVAMPHVLASLQGIQEPIYRVREINGEKHKKIVGLKIVEKGDMSAEEYKAMVNDLVNFLSYVGNPIKEKSKKIGIYVLAFLAIMLVLCWAIKKEYWKDIKG